MKIANMVHIGNVKALFTKAALVALFAGAAFVATPQKASAQVAFGIQFGHPGYVRRVPVYAPVYQQPYVETYAANTYYAPAAPAYGGYDLTAVATGRGTSSRSIATSAVTTGTSATMTATSAAMTATFAVTTTTGTGIATIAGS